MITDASILPTSSSLQQAQPSTAATGIETSGSVTFLADLLSADPEAGPLQDLIDYATYSSADDEYDPDSASDDESAMSTDGGVPISMNAAYAEALNSEMDIVDADIMGPHNLAAIAAGNAFASAFDSIDQAMEDGASFPTHEAFSLSEMEAFSLSDMEPPFDEVAFTATAPQPPSLPATILEVAQQQLQNVQDVLDQSAAQHAGLHDPSNHPIFSNPFANSISGQSSLEDPYASSSFAFAADGSTPLLVATTTPLFSSQGSESGLNYSQFSGLVLLGIALLEEYDDGNQANAIVVEDHLNLPLVPFLENWAAGAARYSLKKRKLRGPHLGALREQVANKPVQILREDLQGDALDFQGINWAQLDVSRKEARSARARSYTNYTNLLMPNGHPLTLMRSRIKKHDRSFFKFRRMDFRHEVNLSHFQLRNLVASTSRNNVFYAGDSRVWQANPVYDVKTVRMNLSKPRVQPSHAGQWSGIQISTVAADHNVLIAGGFCGEYGMVALDVLQPNHTEGLIIDDPNSITNHVQIQLNRQSGLPQAAIASNDCGLRILDCSSNTFVAQHMYDYAINCSAISPDHRLRVLVGDAKKVLICNAETGQVLQDLDGHVDYGFACAWADNGWHVATGNQDMLVKIWDARMWTDSNGNGKPLRNIAAHAAGVRSLKFSPVGSGKRVLIAAEPADIVSVIDADSYESTQKIDFFGEVAGVSLTPDGQNLFIGIHDSLGGGIMELDRCGFGQLHGYERMYYERRKLYNGGEDRDLPAAWRDWKWRGEDGAADSRSVRTATHDRRRAVNLGDMEAF